MTQFELLKIAKKIRKLHFIPWHERIPVLPKVKNYPGGAEAWFDNFLNEWIPSQKDSSNLMSLFILCKFDPIAFLKIIVAPPPGRKKKAS